MSPQCIKKYLIFYQRDSCAKFTTVCKFSIGMGNYDGNASRENCHQCETAEKALPTDSEINKIKSTVLMDDN
jgi:hypothetical protein